MRIQKIAKPAGQVVTQVLDHGTFDSVADAEVLGVWAYLRTRPDGWVGTTKQVQEHFGFGTYRIRRVMRVMRELGLVCHESGRRRGKFTGKEIIISYASDQQPVKLEIVRSAWGAK